MANIRSAIHRITYVMRVRCNSSENNTVLNRAGAGNLTNVWPT